MAAIPPHRRAGRAGACASVAIGTLVPNGSDRRPCDGRAETPILGVDGERHRPDTRRSAVKKAFPIALIVLGVVFLGGGSYTIAQGFDAKDQVRHELIAQRI